jgi:flagellar hook-basal body complex protein FliE
MTPISSIAPTAIPGVVTPSSPAGKPGEFLNLLQGAMGSLQSTQSQAADAVQKFLTGENEELHSTVLAAQRAEIAFELALQVRNKVVQAYQEVMRMQM